MEVIGYQYKGPKDYTTGRIDVIDFIQDKQLNYSRGNAVRYIVRAGTKDPDTEIEDLEKAIFYLNAEITDLRNRKARIEELYNSTMFHFLDRKTDLHFPEKEEEQDDID